MTKVIGDDKDSAKRQDLIRRQWNEFSKKEAFKEFKLGLQRHIVWEEELLFPIWEEKTGMVEDGDDFDWAKFKVMQRGA